MKWKARAVKRGPFFVVVAGRGALGGVVGVSAGLGRANRVFGIKTRG